MNELLNIFKNIKNNSRNTILSDTKINEILRTLADNLIINKNEIITENKKDLTNFDSTNPLFDRLLLNEKRIESIANDLKNIAQFKTPLNIIKEEKTLPNGLYLQKISVPLGVIGVIYEARPNVTIDVFALCLKSGNACVLKGGKEAENTNKILVQIIKNTFIQLNLNSNVIHLLPNDKNATEFMLNAVGLVDVCIPRGSQNLIEFVRKNAKIPVIETGAGIVHTYFDETGDVAKGIKIIENAKTRRVSVCNALDTLIIHEKRLEDLYKLVEPLALKNVLLYADEKSFAYLNNKYPQSLLSHATKEHFGTEFLDYKMSIKTVANLQEAITHIHKYSSFHSEAIIAEDNNNIDEFLLKVDAAVVYANAPTSFTDGGQFGMGAEIGISTQKLHARGPMALAELTSYKWLVRGNAQIRNT